MKYILKYSPEITIKSTPVRNRFSRRLGRNLEAVLARVTDGAQVGVFWDYLEVTCPGLDKDGAGGEVERALANTPGIGSFQRVRKYPLDGLEDVQAKALVVYGGELEGKSFAVRCKRAGRHEFSSLDVEREVGKCLLERSGARRVDLSNPDVTVRLEIRDRDLFISERRFKGLGGFPLGTQDAVLSLISGGFDSAVASYLSMKRGLVTHFCFFNLGGREHEVAVKEVAAYLWMKYGASRRVKFVTVPFEAVVREILAKVSDSQMGVVLKRMMLRVAERVARQLHVEALITGESVAQVSSQTLANLAVIDKAVDMLVMRPLVMSDKQDIVNLAREIGTEEFSAGIPEYCGVISVKPTTRARRHRIEKEEAGFDFNILEQAIEAARVAPIDRLQREEEAENRPVDETAIVAPGAVILDIRHPEEEERKPLSVEGAEIRRVPFYRLNTVFATLDPATRYLLYCGKGIMSRLHASYLRDQGYENVAVYRPPGKSGLPLHSGPISPR